MVYSFFVGVIPRAGGCAQSVDSAQLIEPPLCAPIELQSSSTADLLGQILYSENTNFLFKLGKTCFFFLNVLLLLYLLGYPETKNI